MSKIPLPPPASRQSWQESKSSTDKPVQNDGDCCQVREPASGALAVFPQDVHFTAACEAAVRLLDHEEQSHDDDAQLDQYVYEHHDEAVLDRVIKRLLGVSEINDPPFGTGSVPTNPKHHKGPPPGLSELDDAPGAVLVAKPAFIELQHPKTEGSHDHDARVNHFQGHELSHSAGDLGVNLGLDGAMGIGGGIALAGGIIDFRNAGKRENVLLPRKRIAEEKIRAFSEFLASQNTPPPSETAGARSARLRKISIVQNELIALESELQRIHTTLGHCDKEKKVAVGSGAAGLISLIRAICGVVAKPLAFSLPATAGAARTALSTASVLLAPLGAGAALYMGKKARDLSEAQRKEVEEKFAAAFEELGMVEGKMPKDVWEHYKRCFVDSKLHSRAKMAKSFNELLKWFVGAMKAYVVTTTAISTAKIIALIVAGAILADVTLSAGVLTAATAVLLTLYGFMRYQSKMNRYEVWANSSDPGFDKDFMLSLAAKGDVNGLVQPVKLSMLLHKKRERRQDFLHAISSKAGLRFDGLKMHSTDTEAVRAKRKEQKETTGKNATQRFLATHGFTSKNAKALAKGTGGFVSTAIRKGAGDATKHAKQTFAQNTDFLTETRLAALLQSPEHNDLIVNHMLEDVEDDLRYLDDEIQQKIKLYHLEDSDDAPSVSDSQNILPIQETASPDRSGDRKEKWGRRFLRRFGKKPSSANEAKQHTLSPNAHVAHHFHRIGHGLLNDQTRYQDMRTLRDQLKQWKREPSHDPARLAGMQSRFLSIQQRRVHDPLAKHGEPTAQQWATDLMREGKKRDRATLGRLEVFIPETAALRQTAASVHRLLPMPDTYLPGWEAYLMEHEAEAA